MPNKTPTEWAKVLQDRFNLFSSLYPDGIIPSPEAANIAAGVIEEAMADVARDATYTPQLQFHIVGGN